MLTDNTKHCAAAKDQRGIRPLVLALLVAIACFIAAAPSQAAPVTPVVYTGLLHHARNGHTQLVRLFLVRSTKPGASTSSITAFMELYFGSFESPEYIGFYYDPVPYNASQRTLFLQRDDDLRGRRLPTLTLTYSADGQSIKGGYISQTQGYIGEVDLKAGWASPQVDSTLLTGIGGTYEAKCPATDGSALDVQDVEIIPSRIFTDRIAPEGALNTTNYLGHGLCNYTGLTSCVSFSTGTYDLYSDQVTLYQGAWIWQCNRATPDKLACTSPRYKRCNLYRRDPIEAHVTPAPTVGPSAPVVPEAQHTAFSGPQTCEAWNGTFNGMLTYRDGRRQPMSVSLATFTLDAASSPQRCLMTGSAVLYFTKGKTGWEKIVFPIPQTEFNPAQADQVFFSDNYTDLVLQLNHSTPGVFEGNWYSRLYGLAGGFRAERDSTPTMPERHQMVPGIAGDYVMPINMQRVLELTTVEAGFDKYSHDPFVQLMLGGYFETRLDTPGFPNAVRDGIVGGSYDYFTNYLVLRSSFALYSGFVTPDNVTIHGVPRGYLVPSHPIDDLLDYTRH